MVRRVRENSTPSSLPRIAIRCVFPGFPSPHVEKFRFRGWVSLSGCWQLLFWCMCVFVCVYVFVCALMQFMISTVRYNAGKKFARKAQLIVFGTFANKMCVTKNCLLSEWSTNKRARNNRAFDAQQTAESKGLRCMPVAFGPARKPFAWEEMGVLDAQGTFSYSFTLFHAIHAVFVIGGGTMHNNSLFSKTNKMQGWPDHENYNLKLRKVCVYGSFSR